ncbi:MAG: hypothetical protein U0841_11890 [Chloroflexia bacterium]
MARRRGFPALRALTRLQHLALALAPRLFGFQWVITARVCQNERRA